MHFRRVFLIVMDGVGIGALPDADAYGDAGSCTLGALTACGLRIPTLESLGIGNIPGAPSGIPPARPARAFFGRLAEQSPGKDSTTGHWELMGVVRESMPRTFPHGFPRGLIQEFSRRIGRGVLGNRAASGTEIIAQLGCEHIRTGSVIVYTSADSVFQVAAHKDVVPLEELYRICQLARELLHGEYAVDRVIARPFVGSGESGFQRTKERRDFSLPPPRNCLDTLVEAGVEVTLVGKLEDMFAGRGFTRSFRTACNDETAGELSRLRRDGGGGFYFANFIDFDMLYGHRNDVEGFAKALSAFDGWLASFTDEWFDGDLLLLTADHGNDPATPSTDHSREYVPLLVFRGEPLPGLAVADLGTRKTFADVGATIVRCLGIDQPGSPLAGQDFYANITAGLRR